jgi:hypothetical protein
MAPKIVGAATTLLSDPCSIDDGGSVVDAHSGAMCCARAVNSATVLFGFVVKYSEGDDLRKLRRPEIAQPNM